MCLLILPPMQFLPNSRNQTPPNLEQTSPSSPLNEMRPERHNDSRFRANCVFWSWLYVARWWRDPSICGMSMHTCNVYPRHIMCTRVAASNKHLNTHSHLKLLHRAHMVEPMCCAVVPKSFNCLTKSSACWDYNDPMELRDKRVV